MRPIALRLRTGGFAAAYVDEEDFDNVVAAGPWTLHYTEAGNYAKRTLGGRKNKTCDFLHRWLIDAPPETLVDHVDGNTLNNSRSNLRLATVADNQHNRRKGSGREGRPFSSKYKGVSWFKAAQCWRATIVLDKKQRSCGYYDNEMDAAVAYDEAARRLFGEFAAVNFPHAGERTSRRARDPSRAAAASRS